MRLPDAPGPGATPEEWTRWATDLVRVLQSHVDSVERGYQQKADPVRLPIATVSALTASLKTPRPTITGGSRLVYCVDASAGAIPCYADGSAWRRVDNGSTVT